LSHEHRPSAAGLSLKCLLSSSSQSLEAPFTLDEVSKAIWDCDGSNASGNFNLKRFWPQISSDAMKFIVPFCAHGSLPKSTKSAFLMLIPKKATPY